MLPKIWLAAPALASLLACQSSGSTGGVKVSGTGSTEQPAAPYGLPTETPIGAERQRATPTPLPSNIPPTPRSKT